MYTPLRVYGACECVCERACEGESESGGQWPEGCNDETVSKLLLAGLKPHKLLIYFMFPLFLIQSHTHTHTHTSTHLVNKQENSANQL